MKKVIIIIVVLAMAFCMIAAGYPEKESNEAFEEYISDFCAAVLEGTDNQATIKREGNKVSIVFDSDMAHADLDGFGIAIVVFDGDANTRILIEIGFIDGERVVAMEKIKILDWESQDYETIFEFGEFR